MRRARRFPSRLVRWTSLCVCLALFLSSLAMVPLPGSNSVIALAQGRSDAANGKGRKVKPEPPVAGPPAASLPNLDEVRQRPHVPSRASSEIPSMMRSRRKLVESRNGRKVTDGPTPPRPRRVSTSGRNLNGGELQARTREVAVSPLSVKNMTARSHHARGTYRSNAPVTGNASAFVSQSVQQTMLAGYQYAVSLTFQNTGGTTWTAATWHNLGSQNPQDNGTWGVGRAALAATTAPGQQATFNFTVTAPSTPGTYNFQWRTVQDYVEWFGAYSTNLQIVVHAAVSGNGSVFVSQSVPQTMLASNQHSVSMTFLNTGSTTWTAAAWHNLGSQNPQDNFTWGAARAALPATTAPGQQATFSFTVTAPSTPGTYNFQWRMVQDAVEWFGAYSTNLQIMVSPGSTPYSGTPIQLPGSIEVENYDNGGAEVAYHDTTAGTHGQDYNQPPNYPPPAFRQPTDVDIYKSTGYSNSYLVLGQAGDWTKYTVNVAATGSYTLQAQVTWGGTSGSPGTFHVEVDGIDKTGAIQIPDMNWSLTIVTKTEVQLDAGQHVMRIVWDTNAPNGYSGDIDYVTFTAAGGGSPYGGTPAVIPGTVEIENYDNGGAEVAYHDTSGQ